MTYSVLSTEDAIFAVLERSDQLSSVEEQNVLIFALSQDLIEAKLLDSGAVHFQPLIVITPEGYDEVAKLRAGESADWELDPLFRFAVFFMIDEVLPLLEKHNALR